jgi:hypothetical protein
VLLLTSTSDKIQVVTGSSGTVEVHASWVDNASGTITPDRANTSISSATTTDVVDSPGASTQRNVKLLAVRNDHASTSNTVEIRHTDGTTPVTLWSGTLLAGEAVVRIYFGSFLLILNCITPFLHLHNSTTTPRPLHCPPRR